jgi:hypothetical protein
LGCGVGRVLDGRLGELGDEVGQNGRGTKGDDLTQTIESVVGDLGILQLLEKICTKKEKGIEGAQCKSSDPPQRGTSGKKELVPGTMSSMALLVTDLYNLSKASAAASRTSSNGSYRARDTAGMMMWRYLNMGGEGKGQVSEKRDGRKCTRGVDVLGDLVLLRRGDDLGKTQAHALASVGQGAPQTLREKCSGAG